MKIQVVGALGAAVLAMAAACEGDGSAVSSPPASGAVGGENAAGGGGEPQGGSAMLAGAPSAGDTATGGAAGGAGGTGAEPSAGEAGAGAGGQPAMPVAGDIHGRILAVHEPVEGDTIAVGDFMTTTDANGEFLIPDAAGFYDLVIVDPVSKVAALVEHMSTRAPVVQMPPTAAGAFSATLSGKLSGGAGFPNPAMFKTSYAFYADNCNAQATASTGVSDDFYSLKPGWSTGASAAGSLYVLQWLPGADAPTAFTGFARKPFTLSDAVSLGKTDGSVAATNVALSSVSTRVLKGTLSAPMGYAESGAAIMVGPIVVPFSLAVGPYSTLVPTGLDAPLRIAASTVGTDGAVNSWWEIPDQSALDMDLPAAPKLLTPAKDETMVDYTTTFSWTSPSGGVDSVQFYVGDWTVTRMPVGNTTTLPDLSAYGVNLPTGFYTYWLVTNEGPTTSRDSVLDLEAEIYATPAGARKAWSASAAGRPFKLKPSL